MGEGRRSLLVFALILLAADGAAAKNISISITPTVEQSGDQLTASVAVKNGGDEAAQSVSIAFFFRDQQARSDVRPQLAPQEGMQATLTIPAGDLGRGRWPYRVAVDYTDANQYPFQAMHSGLVMVGNPPPAKLVVAEVKGGPLSSESALNIRIKNLSGVERAAKVSATAPEGIEVTTPPADVRVPPWAEARVEHSLVNRTALAGSRYPLFVTLEYDDEGVHQAVVGQGVVDIRAEQSFFETWSRAFWIFAVVFVVAWIAFLVWRATAPRQRRAETRP